MRTDEGRFVWIFVMFDLPVVTKTERKAATKFREFLLDDGFLMIQFSIYARACQEEAADKHIARVTKQLPPAGSVRILQITDAQYARMKVLIGRVTENEKLASKQLILL